MLNSEAKQRSDGLLRRLLVPLHLARTWLEGSRLRLQHIVGRGPTPQRSVQDLSDLLIHIYRDLSPYFEAASGRLVYY